MNALEMMYATFLFLHQFNNDIILCVKINDRNYIIMQLNSLVRGNEYYIKTSVDVISYIQHLISEWTSPFFVNLFQENKDWHQSSNNYQLINLLILIIFLPIIITAPQSTCKWYFPLRKKSSFHQKSHGRGRSHF